MRKRRANEEKHEKQRWKFKGRKAGGWHTRAPSTEHKTSPKRNDDDKKQQEWKAKKNKTNEMKIVKTSKTKAKKERKKS